MNISVHANNQIDSNADSMSHAGSTSEKMSRNTPVATGYVIVKNSENDSLKLKKEGYSKNFGQDVVEW